MVVEGMQGIQGENIEMGGM